MLASYSQCLLFTTWNLSISLIFSKSQLLDWYINSHQCSEGPGNIGKNMWEFKETQILQSINVRDLFQEVQQHFKDNNFIEIPTEHKILLHTTQFSGFKSIRGIVQPPPLSNFRTFSLFQKEAWHPSAAIPCSHTASRARAHAHASEVHGSADFPLLPHASLEVSYKRDHGTMFSSLIHAMIKHRSSKFCNLIKISL